VVVYGRSKGRLQPAQVMMTWQGWLRAATLCKIDDCRAAAVQSEQWDIMVWFI